MSEGLPVGPMAADLKGKRAIVTGAATGIGRAIARALALHGVAVAVADLSADGAATVAEELGGDALSLQVDVRERPSVEAMFAALEQRWGGYDIVIANAGVSTMNRAIDLTDEEWNFNFDVNIRGIFLTNQIAARYFLAKHSADSKGVIVNTASLAAKVGAPLLAHYSASKFAVLGWTQGLARELAPHGIRVNAIAPGLTDTAQPRYGNNDTELIEMARATIPLGGRLLTPDQIARTAVFLASDESDATTGQVIHVNGGAYMP